MDSHEAKGFFPFKRMDLCAVLHGQPYQLQCLRVDIKDCPLRLEFGFVGPELPLFITDSQTWGTVRLSIGLLVHMAVEIPFGLITEHYGEAPNAVQQ